MLLCLTSFPQNNVGVQHSSRLTQILVYNYRSLILIVAQCEFTTIYLIVLRLISI